MLKASFLLLFCLLLKLPSGFLPLHCGGRQMLPLMPRSARECLIGLVLRWDTEVLLLLSPEERRSRVSREQPSPAAGDPVSLCSVLSRAGEGIKGCILCSCSVPGWHPWEQPALPVSSGAVGAHPTPHMHNHWFSSALQHSSQQGKTTEGNGLRPAVTAVCVFQARFIPCCSPSN